LKRIGLRELFNVIAILIALVILISSIFSIIISQRLYSRTISLEKAFVSVDIANQLGMGLLIYHGESYLARTRNKIKHEQKRISERLKFPELLYQSKQNGSNSLEEDQRREDLSLAINNYLHIYDELTIKGASTEEIFEQTTPIVEHIITLISDFINLKRKQADSLMKKSQMEDNMLKMTILPVVILALALALALIISIQRFIYKPLIKLRNSIREFNASFNVRTPITEGPKEIIEIEEAFNEMGERVSKQRESQYHFLSAIAHDLKNPLSAIALSSRLLFKNNQDIKPEFKEMLGIINRQVKYLNRMVGDLLDITRIEAGKLEFQKKKIDILNIVKDAVELHRSISPIHHFKLSAPDGPFYCMIDPLRIGQVMNNLISNALKYSPKGGDILVEVSKRKNEVVIEITDPGIGIREEDKKRIFEPFRRTQQTRDTIPGIGLGLSASKRIIEAHKGKIELTSRADEGTSFFIYLPFIEI
jgi:two-component system, OmpR family, sensor histidine kinase MtrB